MTVRSNPARRAPAAAGASLSTPVLGTGAVHLLTPPAGAPLVRSLRRLFRGRTRIRDGRIRGVPISCNRRRSGVTATFDGRIRSLLSACAGRLCPALTS